MVPTIFQVLVTVIILPNFIHSYYTAIDAHAEECFHERVVTGTKLGLMFEVVEGGFLDIDVKITGNFLNSSLTS